MTTNASTLRALLLVPRLRIQNANAISSPMTHGFPSMTAFLGLMWALERKVAERHLPITFQSVGVICHEFDEQTTEGGYTKAFRLTRNPVDKDGSTMGIVEEGRIHLEVTLVFAIDGACVDQDRKQQQILADSIAELIAGMRVAGGSVLPSRSHQWRIQPMLQVLSENPDDAARQFRRLRRQWLPGFALVSRDDLLESRLQSLRETNPSATQIDAWLDLSRFNWCSTQSEPGNEMLAEAKAKVEWKHDRSEGWIVPIPVGYAALSEVHPAGSVLNARDQSSAFRFVESLYSIGQWIGPHRLTQANQLLWYSRSDVAKGLYRCCNDFVINPSINAH